MKGWMDEYIRLCLARVPSSSLRQRMSAELADHLESLADSLEEDGFSPHQARSLALERMGDPQALARDYEAVWRRRAGAPRYWAPRLGLGCICTGVAYLLTLSALGLLGVTYDATPGMPIIGNPFLTAMVGCALFFLPFSAGGIFLLRLLRGCPHPGGLVTAGLLLAWAGEKAAVLSLSALIYGLPLWEPGPLLARISGESDPTAPWFTPAYILLTLCGCLLLGVLADRSASGRFRIPLAHE